MNTPADDADQFGRTEPPPRRMGPLLWVLIALAVLLVAIGASLGWVLNTESGARWVAGRAVGFLAGKLEIREVHGTIVGPLSVTGVRYHDDEAGVDARVERASVDVAFKDLLSWRVHVQTVDVSGVDVRLSESKKKDEPSNFSLEPPIDILLDRFTLKEARVSKDGKELFVARTAEAVGSWTALKGIAIDKLVVDSPDGNVHLAGEVDDRGSYVGRATGGFRWKFGDTSTAGDLTASSEKQQLNVQLRLSAPFAARLDATLGETKAFPWQFNLSVPKFDPRENNLLSGDSLQSLAATLNGKGDLTVAELHGDVALNGKSLRIEPLRVRLQEQVIQIEALTLIDPARRGTLNANGSVSFGDAAAKQPHAPPFYADLLVSWKDVELPKEWVGQPLSTHGGLKVVGSVNNFDASGKLALGPPGRLADIDLAIVGTPEQIDVQKFAIVQKNGNLSASGTVKLQPQIGWQLTARATRFDPGAFLAGWGGSLGFELDTKGQVTPQGPSASLDIKNLAGTLRGRALSAQAALTLTPQKVIGGTLKARSGHSTVTLTGHNGKTMDVDTEFDIASLDDWLPKATGTLNGKFHITGAWPKLAVEGGAHGRALAFDGYSVKSVDVTADVKNPQSPSGSLSVKASEISASGFEFSSVELDASGDDKDHTVNLTALGQPLTGQLRVHGARQGDGWAGTVDQLTLAAVGIEPLSLRAPAKVTWSPRGFSVSESCLAGTQISACVAADQNAAGELNAKYKLEHLPLGLIAALAAPNLPMQIEAVIEGEGHIRRAPDGELFGEAQVTSTSGRISDALTAAQEDAADALLTYENLKLDAQLAGDTAHATLSATLGGGGSLEGRMALAELRGASPTLDGNAKLVIGDLSPLGLFVPQLADVKGRGNASVDIGGTFANPQITGSAQLLEMAAEVPQVGIKLHDGEMQASMKSGNDVTLTGKVSSGDGQITFNGHTEAGGVIKVKVQGKNFLAADMPGAKVTIEPDLDFERTADRMTLGGSVLVPKAEVDLTKLPKQSGVQHASADVVVVDDEAVEQSKSVPLEANVTVILGKDVSLIGYGLNAKVEGQVVVHEVQNEATTGNGEIRVTGTYKAYGQDLTIEQGRLLFAGQAINDPQVNLIASRTVDAVKAKLNVSGSAQKPQLTVTSDPTMSQTQALSYLVAGKPLNEVGSGEGDMVQSAARSLGGAAGNLLAKGLGKRLGISEIGVEDSPEIGGSAFTVGQYLSPRLYLSYGVGLFDPGQVVTLRYRISDKVSLEAVQGTLSQKAGINYRIEK
ncbi:MAG TPA: translocation/assembly module TamB domain-containing protein [Steroidobacteraceae bacterium]|nr:translocation/assembly module TamB domain-containing protein [Steroidobacteraceae bacterium]